MEPPQQTRNRRKGNGPVEGVDYEVIPAQYEEIRCSIQIKDEATGTQRPCGARISNDDGILHTHFKVHENGKSLPNCIAACPFGGKPCGGTRGTAKLDLATYIRQVLRSHFRSKKEFRCLLCGTTQTRYERTGSKHGCAPDQSVASEPASSSMAGLAEEETWVEEGPIEGPSASTISDFESHDRRPAKRPRIDR